MYSCKKDQHEEGSVNQLLPNASLANLEQARKKLRTQTEINFFGFEYATQNNPNTVPVASGRGDEEVINALAYEIIMQNHTHHFVNELVAEVGYPFWN
jgi:hypothetical protein